MNLPNSPVGFGFDLLYNPLGFLVVGGWFDAAFSNVMIFNESTNTFSNFGELGGQVTSIAHDPVGDNYIAVGNTILKRDGKPMRGVAIANLTSRIWTPLGHVNDLVYDVFFNPHDNTVIIAGVFSRAMETCANGVAVYNGLLPNHPTPPPTPIPTPIPTPPTPSPTPIPTPPTPSPTSVPTPLPTATTPQPSPGTDSTSTNADGSTDNSQTVSFKESIEF